MPLFNPKKETYDHLDPASKAIMEKNNQLF